MNGPDRAAAFACWWARRYTRGLPDPVAERRRAEIASDGWEQRAYARDIGAPAFVLTVSIVRRVLAGVPADLRWSRAQVAATRGVPPGWEGSPVSGWLRRNWWVVLAVLVGAFELAMGVDQLVDEPKRDNVLALAAFGGFASLVIVGAWLRPRRRVAGDIMIAIGVLPMLPFVWMVVPPVVALIVVVAALVDVADAKAVRRADERRAERL